MCAETLCRPFHKLFSLSLETSDFPHRWKESFVIPLHKKKSKLNAFNFKEISKLSAIQKLLRSIKNTVVGPLFPLVATDL